MTINDIIYGVAKYFSWLYFRHWERWELLIIALISVVLLLLIVRQQRKGAVKKVYANQFRERSPVIGVKLADSRSHAKSRVPKRDRPASLSKKDQKEKRTKKQLKNLNKQIQLLQLEISKHEQNEKRLEQQIAGLTTANNKLQEKTVKNHRVAQSDRQPAGAPASVDNLRQKITKKKKAEQYSEREIVGVPAASEQPRQEVAKSQKNEQQPSNRTGQPRALRNLSTQRVLESLQPDRTLREKTEHFKTSKEVREEPLDVQKLKAIAELAKQIQGRRRRY
jgi:hypothetical protein